ncbi:MAG: hypothetical protein M0C28_31055 [Candidatus Moduliflexus flocculans]|nr:hypothetical protein [Candidatus Moduliflexus flocculans]
MVIQPLTKTLGPLDPAFVALHHQHMKDETRHVHIDALLIERCMDDRRADLNVRLFTAMLAGVVRRARGGSGVKVVRQLIIDLPELAPRGGGARRGRVVTKGRPALSGELVQSPHHAAHVRTVRRHAGIGEPG